tara:strand:- start:9876 stop:10898 length:1023 start_codon:yes stop_codon:yes gene_type:complete
MTSSNPSKIYRYWLLVKPDVAHPTGGIKQLHRLAEALGELNREATLIQDKADFHPGWFESNVNTISETEWLKRTDLAPEQDIVVMPETYNGEFLTFAPELPKIIFNQNAAYSFGIPDSNRVHRPAGLLELYQHSSIKHILCVSEHDHALISEGFQAGEERVSVIRNAIEVALFKPNQAKKKQVCYMPRKNPRDALITIAMLQQCDWFQQWSVVPIEKKSQEQVAQIMQESLVFLSFGHPEGFGLPVAEAMACGCSVIGYSGLGGRELYQLGQSHGTTHEAALGDYLEFVRAAKRVNDALHTKPEKLFQRLVNCSKDIRNRYNQTSMLGSVKKALNTIEAN